MLNKDITALHKQKAKKKKKKSQMDPDLSEFVRSYVNERPPYVMLLWDTHVQYVSCDTEQSK